MEKTGNITVKQFIEDYLIRDIGDIKEKYPYFDFLLMSVGFEFLGKCLVERDWHVDNYSKEDFCKGFETTGTEDKYNSLNLYRNLRCGLVHSLLIKDGILLSDKGNDHLLDSTISCGEFYELFKKACEKVINGEVEVKKDLYSTFFIVSKTNDSSVTGTTQTDVIVQK